MKQCPTVLLVEDNPNDAFLFQEALRDSAIPVQLQHVPDAHSAINYLKGEGRFADRQSHPLPGLVVLDLHMPGMEGIALLRWIRKQEWLRGLPVVVCSGSDHGQSLTEAMQSGADTYIVKGHETRDLVHLLEHANLNWKATKLSPQTTSA